MESTALRSLSMKGKRKCQEHGMMDERTFSKWEKYEHV